jgi:ferredoxin-NADP reductase
VGTPADAVALALTDEDSRPDIYVCGPPALIEATKSVSVWAGIGRDRVFSEQFSPS